MALFQIARLGAGRLFVSPRPQSDELTDWATTLKGNKIDHVVCLMQVEELVRVGLSGAEPSEASVLYDHSINYSHFPILDYSIPEFAGYYRFLCDLHVAIQTGENYLVHCAGGIGRAGTTACCILVLAGQSGEQAIANVSAERGCVVPETPEQIAFIHEFHKHHHAMKL